MADIPLGLREAWADVYRLFHANYGMDGSDKAWEQYWKNANSLIVKYGDEIPLLELLEAVAKMIDTMQKHNWNMNKSMPWNKDEDYPYPKNSGRK